MEGAMPIHWSRWLTLAGIAEWRMPADGERSEAKRIDRPEHEPIDPTAVARDLELSGFKIPAYDVSPLFRRLALLNVDGDELAEDEPLLFHELQGLCALCQSKRRCVRDLAEESSDTVRAACPTTSRNMLHAAAERQEWRGYCPNATTLNALGALQNCSRAARHLKTPRSTRFFEGS
jgi:hypothetical protein